MPVVNHTIKEPGGRVPRIARYRITLVGATVGNGEGHVGAEGLSIGGEWSGNADPITGTWSETLKANVLVTIPANSVYKVEETLDNTTYVLYILVPNGAGPYNVGDILSDVPTGLPGYPLDTHIAASPAHAASAVSFVPGGSIAATNAQAAVAEVATDYIAADSAEATTRANADTTETNARIAADATKAPLAGPFAPTGFTGATAASRYVGATASAAPTTGTFAIGDYVIDRTGKIWICTTAGTPGTWTQVEAGVMPLTGTVAGAIRQNIFTLQPTSPGVGAFSAGTVGTYFATSTVTNKALTSNVATITTAAAHQALVGQTITVAISDAVFDGDFVIATVPSATTFTYAKTNANVASVASGGTTGTRDYVVDFGYNPRRVVNTEPSFTFTIEHNYEPGPGVHWVEAYFEWTSANGALVQRPWFMVYNRASGLIQSFTFAAPQIQILNEARTGGAYFVVQDGGLQLGGTSNYALDMYVATGGQVEMRAFINGVPAFNIQTPTTWLTKVMVNNVEVARLNYLGGEPCFAINDLSGEGLNKAQFFVAGWSVARPIVIIRALVDHTANILQTSKSDDTALFAVTGAGLPKWSAASMVQTTVGAAGAASAPPATPTKWLKVVADNGTTYVVPAYAAS